MSPIQTLVTKGINEERERWNAKVPKLVADSVTAEREACAKIAEGVEPVTFIGDGGFQEESVWRTQDLIAAEIRARGRE